MKPDRTQPDKPLSLKSLEAQLRQLPRPKLPGHLQERLIAGIPTGQPAAKAGHGSIRRWLLPAASAAACIIATLSIAHFHMQRPDASARPTDPSVAAVDIQRMVEREANSARLAATARILSQQPGMQSEAERTYQYIAQAYGDTAVARQIPSSTQQTQGEI